MIPKRPWWDWYEYRYLDIAERDGNPRCKAWAEGRCVHTEGHKGNHRLQNGFCWTDYGSDWVGDS